MEIEQIIDHLDLSPHPEGGYYREIYRSEEKVQRSGSQLRSASTGIYFLVPSGVCTNWHRVCSDEVWHFYKGDPLTLEIIDNDGTLKRQVLHNQFSSDTVFRSVVPRNFWQRAYSQGTFSLVECTVSPGFEFEDFDMIDPASLADRYPKLAKKIKRNPFS